MQLGGRRKRENAFGHLVPGRRYRVVRLFRDHDGVEHTEGETWTFLGSNFLPYEDGLTLRVAPTGGLERTIRLQWRAEAEGAVIEALESYIVAEDALPSEVEAGGLRKQMALGRLLRTIFGCAVLLAVPWAAGGGMAAEAGPPNGPALVAIAPDRPSREDLASEAYFDWTAHLEDFLIAKPAALGFARMSAEGLRNATGVRIEGDYATVFRRPDSSMIVWEGMVLDPPVYEAGVRWALGDSIASAGAMGFRVLSRAEAAEER